MPQPSAMVKCGNLSTTVQMAISIVPYLKQVALCPFYSNNGHLRPHKNERYNEGKISPKSLVPWTRTQLALS